MRSLMRSMLIVPIIHERYGLYMSEDEISFLTMYVMPFLKAQSLCVPTILINGTSQSFANLLSIRLNQEFRDKLEIVCQIPLQQLPAALKEHPAQLIISDMVLDQSLPLPLIEITQLPEKRNGDGSTAFEPSCRCIAGREHLPSGVLAETGCCSSRRIESFADIIRLCALRLQQEGCIEDGKTLAGGAGKRGGLSDADRQWGLLSASAGQ
ncbi:MAG: hypothetical protein ACLVJ6_11330 [Merdibacter sp.]